MRHVSKFIRDCLTERDGQTWDLNRVLFAVAVITFLATGVTAVAVRGQPLNWLEAGGGVGAVLGTSGRLEC